MIKLTIGIESRQNLQFMLELFDKLGFVALLNLEEQKVKTLSEDEQAFLSSLETGYKEFLLIKEGKQVGDTLDNLLEEL